MPFTIKVVGYFFAIILVYSLINVAFSSENRPFNQVKSEAEKGDRDAQFQLALLYYRGKGIDKNYTKAVKWFTEAAKQGDSLAQYNLGVMYENGEGVMQSNSNAAHWYQQASDNYYSTAQYRVALFYIKSEFGFKRNYPKAIKLLRKSARKNNSFAQLQLGIMYYHGLGTPKNVGVGIKYLEESCEKENTRACKLLVKLAK